MQKYKTATLRKLDVTLDQCILKGSSTEQPIKVNSSNVTVAEFKEDETFKEGGFGDVSF